MRDKHQKHPYRDAESTHLCIQIHAADMTPGVDHAIFAIVLVVVAWALPLLISLDPELALKPQSWTERIQQR